MKDEFELRYNLLGIAFSVVAFLILFQVFRLQFSKRASELVIEGDQYQYTVHVYYPPRGSIFDKWGRLLAGNIQAYEVGVDIPRVENPESIAMALTTVLAPNHPEYNRPNYFDEVISTIETAQISGTLYVPLADFVYEDEVEKLKDWALRYKARADMGKEGEQASLHGMVYRPRMARTYPEKTLGSNIIGFVDREGNGHFGIEEHYNELLAGDAELRWMSLNPYQVENIPRVTGGADLILTFDREIQASVEQVLDQALIDSGAEAGTIIVVDPENGEIIAMASTPRMNLNEYWNFNSLFPNNLPYNKAVNAQYEPGSVYKVLTMAAALDAGAVEPDTVFLDTGIFEIGGIFIHNWNYGAWGNQSMLGCLEHSLNVCLAWVGSELGPDLFYSFMDQFGIGHSTGIDLAGETPGRLKRPGDTDWFEADLGTNAFGQGVAVNPVQMVQAVSALANEGKMIAPHLMKAYIKDGFQYNNPITLVGTPISEETAQTITEMLAASLQNESSDALVTGYEVAGKTGTAEIPSLAGYTTNLTNASFVGWGPVGDPKFLVYVWLEKPTSSPWGSVVAAPVFRDVVQQLVVMMDIPPDDIRIQMGNH